MLLILFVEMKKSSDIIQEKNLLASQLFMFTRFHGRWLILERKNNAHRDSKSYPAEMPD